MDPYIVKLRVYLEECVVPKETFAFTHDAKLCGAGCFLLGRLFTPSRNGGLLRRGRPPV